MIVKIQSPIVGCGIKDPKYLIYDEGRNFEVMIPVGLNSSLDLLMEGRLRRYLYAKITKHGVLDITDKETPTAEECDW